jgi:hypothetical protein
LGPDDCREWDHDVGGLQEAAHKCFVSYVPEDKFEFGVGKEMKERLLPVHQVVHNHNLIAGPQEVLAEH